MTGKRQSLLRDALHETAIAGDDVRKVVHDIRSEHGAQIFFRDGHSYAVGEALTEGSRGDLDAVLDRVLGMAVTDRSEFPERFYLFHCHGFVATEVEH